MEQYVNVRHHGRPAHGEQTFVDQEDDLHSAAGPATSCRSHPSMGATLPPSKSTSPCQSEFEHKLGSSVSEKYRATFQTHAAYNSLLAVNEDTVHLINRTKPALTSVQKVQGALRQQGPNLNSKTKGTSSRRQTSPRIPGGLLFLSSLFAGYLVAYAAFVFIIKAFWLDLAVSLIQSPDVQTVQGFVGLQQTAASSYLPRNRSWDWGGFLRPPTSGANGHDKLGTNIQSTAEQSRGGLTGEIPPGDDEGEAVIPWVHGEKRGSRAGAEGALHQTPEALGQAREPGVTTGIRVQGKGAVAALALHPTRSAGAMSPAAIAEAGGKAEEFFCDRSHWRTDVCFLGGDVRLHGPSGLVVLHARSPSMAARMEKIRPYPFKWGGDVMDAIPEITLISTSSSPSAEPEASAKSDSSEKDRLVKELVHGETEGPGRDMDVDNEEKVLSSSELDVRPDGLTERARNRPSGALQVNAEKGEVADVGQDSEGENGRQDGKLKEKKAKNLEDAPHQRGDSREDRVYLRTGRKILAASHGGGEGLEEGRSAEERERSPGRGSARRTVHSKLQRLLGGGNPEGPPALPKAGAKVKKLPRNGTHWAFAVQEFAQMAGTRKAAKRGLGKGTYLGDEGAAAEKQPPAFGIGLSAPPFETPDAAGAAMPLLECHVAHREPGILFSTGGYTGNNYHDWHNGILPLWITSQQLRGDVAFVVLQHKQWWFDKYKHILRALSRYPVVLLGSDPRVHCFPRLTVGLRIHDELAVDPKGMPRGETILDFQKTLRKALDGRWGHMNPKPEGPLTGCRPVLTYAGRTRNRAITNEAEVLNIAREVGFTIRNFAPTFGTLQEDIWHTMQETDVLFGVHGSALTHFLMMRPGAAYIQVIPWGVDWLSYYMLGAPAQKLGLQYTGYAVKFHESSLSQLYTRNDPLVLNANARFEKEGDPLYLDANVTLDLKRIRRVLVKVRDSLEGSKYFVKKVAKAWKNPNCTEVLPMKRAGKGHKGVDFGHFLAKIHARENGPATK